MNHCKDCRHFGEEIFDWSADVEKTGYHKCDYIKHVNRSGSPKYPQEANSGVEDGSGYYAALVVRDDFGCVNFEAKEK